MKDVRYLTLAELLELYEAVMAVSGGGIGVRDLGLIESALAQPRTTFSGSELYQSINEKAAALGFALISNHPFVDGNKRIGHAAMETFLYLNGSQIVSSVDEQERFILDVAAGKYECRDVIKWLEQIVQPLSG